MTDARMPREVSRLIVLLVVLGAGFFAGAGWAFSPRAEPVDWALLAFGAVVVTALQSHWTQFRFRGHRAELVSHDEAVYPFLLVFLGPAGSVLAFTAGSLLANLAARRAPVKAGYNVAQYAIASAVGGAIAFALGGPAASARGVAAVTAGSVAFAITTHALFAALMSRLQGIRWWSFLLKETSDDWVTNGTEALLGITAAMAVKAVPALAPVAVLSVVVVLTVQHRWFAVARDREQVADLLGATSDFHRALTVGDVERALIDAVHTLTSAHVRVSDSPAQSPSALSMSIETGAAGPRWLDVERAMPLDGTAVSVIESLARVAEVSYRFVSLLEERERQAARLTEIIEEREAFLAATAHQLRTPLTAMVGFSKLLWQQPDDPEMIREMMSHLVTQTAEMAHHLDNLLVSSRAVTDSVLIAPERIDLRAEAERLVLAMSPGIPVSVRGPSMEIEADAVRVHHILRNLVFNAHQHGAGEIALEVGGGEPGAWVDVVDEGPGVAAGHEEFIFESFVRAGQGSELPPSAGLGLYVGRLLARLMGGDLTYRRDRDGPTVFRLDLPVSGRAPASAR